MDVFVRMQSCHRCVVSFLCAHAMWLYAMVYTHPYVHVHTHISTHTKTHVVTQIHAPVTFLFPGMVDLFLVWIRTQTTTQICMCIYMDMIGQCDCAYLRRFARACTHARMHVHTHTHGSHRNYRDWSHEIPPFIDLTLHCLLPHCRSLCILADPVFFFSFFCAATSLTVICVLLLFFQRFRYFVLFVHW